MPHSHIGLDSFLCAYVAKKIVFEKNFELKINIAT